MREASWTSQTPTKCTGLFLREPKKVGLPGLGPQNIDSQTFITLLFHSEVHFSIFVFFIAYLPFASHSGPGGSLSKFSGSLIEILVALV